MIDLRDQKFGIELEFTGITRETAANVIAEYYDTYSKHMGGIYDKYVVRDEQRREWKIMSDSSIIPQASVPSDYDSGQYKCEFVTPVCKYSDIEAIQDIVRLLRQKRAKVNYSCGIHVHVDGAAYDERSLRNLVNIMFSKEDILARALNIEEDRLDQWCKKADRTFVEKLNRSKRPPPMNEQRDMWYNTRDSLRCTFSHYDPTRYHMLNLHSYHSNGNIEFRCFNSTLHAGKVKAYIQFCLAVSAQALNQKRARTQQTVSTNECYTFRTWLIRIGLNGDEFKTCRGHMLANLEGAKDWKDKAAAMQRRAERAAFLADSIRATVAHSDEEASDINNVLTEHRRQRHTEVLAEPSSVDENDMPVISIAERVDAFLATISSDAEVSENERNNIISILETAASRDRSGEITVQNDPSERRGR